MGIVTFEENKEKKEGEVGKVTFEEIKKKGRGRWEELYLRKMRKKRKGEVGIVTFEENNRKRKWYYYYSFVICMSLFFSFRTIIVAFLPSCYELHPHYPPPF